MTPGKAELARRFADEIDVIVSLGAVPDCTAQLQAFHASFEAECVCMQNGSADLRITARPNQ